MAYEQNDLNNRRTSMTDKLSRLYTALLVEKNQADERYNRRLLLEQKAKQKLEEDISKLKEVTEAMEKTKFALVLIDADADMYLFGDEYLKQGIAGGERAAHAFIGKVRQYLSSVPNVVKDPKSIQYGQSICQLRRAGKVCLTKDKVNKPGDLRRFWIGFTRAFPLFDVVDAGYGKEEADSKVRDVLSFHVNNIQYAHVLLACCHDLGYVPELRKYSSPATVD